jgi:hypothetical protein
MNQKKDLDHDRIASILGSTHKELDASVQFGPQEFIPHADEPEPPAKCKSCGVPFIDHLGLQGTCATLQRVRALLERWEREHGATATMACRVMRRELEAALEGEGV